MSKVITWIKANPVTVASIAVAVVAVALWLVLVPLSAGAFRQEVTDAANRRLADLERYARQSLTLPGQGADGGDVTVQGVINPATIAKLDELFGRLSQQYKDVFAAVVKLNEDDHRPMLDGLFPSPATDDVPFNARRAYQQALRQMLTAPAGGTTVATLNAGQPPSLQAISDEMARVERDYLSGLFPVKKINELTAAEKQELLQRKQQRLKDYLVRQAQSINIYASLDLTPSQSAFDVGGWAFETNQPQLADLWEGQMGLWIQQDIVKAIARVNHVGDPNYNVMNVPVKRLLKISVVPGYVGLNSTGGIGATGAGAAGGGANTGGGGRAGGSRDAGQEGTDPLAGLASVNYALGPTGRSTNAAYLVRHAWVDVMIDSQRVMAFLDELSRANLNTVLKVQTQDVDEYEQLRQGYVLGSADVVELHVLVESLWLTDWIKPLMPPSAFEGPGGLQGPQGPSFRGPDRAA